MSDPGPLVEAQAAPRYLTVRPGASCLPRYFWQPSREMRAAGWRIQRVPLDWDRFTDPAALHAAAVARATELNDELDHIRAANGKPPRARAPGSQRRAQARRWARERRHIDARAVLEEIGEVLPYKGPQFAYVFASTDGFCKVGVARDLMTRRAQLSTASNRKLIEVLAVRTSAKNARSVERLIFAELHGSRRRGEWFACAPRVAVAAVLKVLARAWLLT